MEPCFELGGPGLGCGLAGAGLVGQSSNGFRLARPALPCPVLFCLPRPAPPRPARPAMPRSAAPAALALPLPCLAPLLLPALLCPVVPCPVPLCPERDVGTSVISNRQPPMKLAPVCEAPGSCPRNGAALKPRRPPVPRWRGLWGTECCPFFGNICMFQYSLKFRRSNLKS